MKKVLAVLTAILLTTGVTAPALAGGHGGHGGGHGGFHGGGGHFHGGGRFHGFYGGVFVAPWWPYGYYPYWPPYGPTCYTMPGQWVWNGYQWVWQPPGTVCP